ncbi:Asp-tRNA(Asn)/Glu-tRNA(Gln) amidotransferase GatCAB subunit A [Granulicella tundricola]|uniref:Amidase n=1 Tax=Granulicella tundricola (strain ATCC BAA-1859 / DSM 23138 / MP5ACTX9) TaxID=1198114 RepID=E8WVA9_GRATM|nr:Asp-tRNA(Asn)/Glu-tRNA(Gln) amidotransferase GatCAB subunit A [Granulicella tundricola]ADW67284.1 Amidase [Granulicella tundricola MP5ACTX9]
MLLDRRRFNSLSLAAAITGFGAGPLASEAAASVAQPPAPETSAEELCYMTIAQAGAALKAGKVTSVQLTRACLDRIDTYNGKLAAYITVLHQGALAQAQRMDDEMKAGKYRGPLHGIPIGLKDNIDTANIRTTAASAACESRIPTEDAPVATRLREAGAVLLGKTNMGEFAATLTSFYGIVRNPWDLTREPGGSSSGSGVSIASGLCFGALGTDTGGSVRHPAHFCGVVGFKPTYGLVPIRNIIPLTFSLDHCGPLTRTVEDNAIMLNAIAGYDPADISSRDHAKEDYVAALKQPVHGFKLGRPSAGFDVLDPEVEALVNTAIALLVTLTKGIQDVNMPDPVLATWTSLGAETYAWHKPQFEATKNLYQPANRAMLQALADKDGGSASSYVDLSWKLQALRRTIDSHFKEVDLVVLPTMVNPAHKLDFVRPPDYNWHDYTNSPEYNAYGIPAISVPCGFTRGGLPVGLTIAGPTFADGKVLALAHAYEQATQWHLKRPPISPTMEIPV